MKKTLFATAVILWLAAACFADTVITKAGSSYSGQYLGVPGGTLGFTDTSGIQYTFPTHDVQSLVFTSTNDTVTLRNGKVYSGTFNGSDPLAFKDNLGILYQFPKKDIESLVFSSAEVAKSMTPPANPKVIPTGTVRRGCGIAVFVSGPRLGDDQRPCASGLDFRAEGIERPRIRQEQAHCRTAGRRRCDRGIAGCDFRAGAGAPRSARARVRAVAS